MKGKDADEFWNRLKLFGNEFSDTLFTSLLDNYKNTFKLFLKDIKELKNNILNAFSTEKEIDKNKE